MWRTSVGTARSRARGGLRWLSLAALATLPGCGLGDLGHIFDLPPTDCGAFTRGPFEIGRSGGDRTLIVGESFREFVAPGLPTDCYAMLKSVTWSVDDPSIVSVKRLGPKNAQVNTAGEISRAWITGRAPGLTKVRARVLFTDGDHEAHAETVRVVAPEDPAPDSFVVAEGSTAVTFNQFTEVGFGELIPITLPADGRVDITVDWSSSGNRMYPVLWEGACAASPCPGRLVIGGGQAKFVKPRRESVPDLAAGDYTLHIGGIGSGQETATYEVRLTPN
jgi:hypothetical protein